MVDVHDHARQAVQVFPLLCGPDLRSQSSGIDGSIQQLPQQGIGIMTGSHLRDDLADTILFRRVDVAIRPCGEHHGPQQKTGRRIQLRRSHSRHRLLDGRRFHRLAFLLGLGPFLVKIPSYCARTDQSGILQCPLGHEGTQQGPQGPSAHQAANTTGRGLAQTGSLFFGRIHKGTERLTNIFFIEDVEKGHMYLSCCCLAQEYFQIVPVRKQRISEYR